MKAKTKQKECALLQNMKVADKMLFLNTVPWHTKRYTGRTILQLHDGDSVGLLMEGVAILTQINHNGEVILSKFISRHHMIDYATEQQEDRYELELFSDTTVQWFQREKFYLFARNNPEFFQHILLCEAAERKFLDRYLAATSKSRAIDKVYELLQWFAATYQTNPFTIPIPYIKLAAMIGISRDRFKESLNELERQNLIQIIDTYQIRLVA